MILYIDTYISEIALSPNKILENFLREVQEKSHVYRKQSKIDIFKYSLASYKPIAWDKVIIKVDGDVKNEILSLENYIKECFPNVDLYFDRSDTGSKYARVLEPIVDDNPWVFFSPNNDHPFIGCDTNVFNSLVEAAERAEKKYELPVSILYSHFTESINSILTDRYLYGYTGDFCKVVDEDEYSYTVKYNHASLLSLQIFRAQHLFQMMGAAKDNRVVRTECLGAYVNYAADILVIVPKTECCRHYDAYMHTSFVVKDYITSSRVPPLFIPDNFFQNKVKIRYGFDDYLNGYININPNMDSYSFSPNGGTDLALRIEMLPYFWKDHIEHIEINPEFEVNPSEQDLLLMDIENPWRHKKDSLIKLVIFYRKIHFMVINPFFVMLRVIELKNEIVKLVRCCARWFQRGKTVI